MDRLEDPLTNPSVLPLPLATGRYTVDTDASGRQSDGIMLQEQSDGHAKPIEYWLRTLTDKKRKLATTHPECLTVAWAVLLLRPDLGGSRFTLQIDDD